MSHQATHIYFSFKRGLSRITSIEYVMNTMIKTIQNACNRVSPPPAKRLGIVQ